MPVENCVAAALSALAQSLSSSMSSPVPSDSSSLPGSPRGLTGTFHSPGEWRMASAKLQGGRTQGDSSWVSMCRGMPGTAAGHASNQLTAGALRGCSSTHTGCVRPSCDSAHEAAPSTLHSITLTQSEGWGCSTCPCAQCCPRTRLRTSRRQCDVSPASATAACGMGFLHRRSNQDHTHHAPVLESPHLRTVPFPKCSSFQ
jgi:hypothetical protein